MAAFVALGILAWNTLSDDRIRLATLAVLAMFAFRTWMHRKDGIGSDHDSEDRVKASPVRLIGDGWFKPM